MVCELYICVEEIADTARPETLSGTWTFRKGKKICDNTHRLTEISENQKVHLRVVEGLLRLCLRKVS